MTSRATTTTFTEADALYRRLGALSAARRRLEDSRDQFNEDVGKALLEVRSNKHLTIEGAALQIGVSKGTAYARLEEAEKRRREEHRERKRRGRKGVGR